MFAVLPIERELFTYKDLLPGFLYWVEAVGSYTTFGLILWVILGYTMMKSKDRARIPSWVTTAFAIGFIGAVTCYSIYGGALFLAPPPPPEFTSEGVPLPRKAILWQDVIAVIGGFCALFAAGLPVGRSLSSLSARRIFALARLSFKEAIRRRILWVFSILILVFLFASWFIPSKPEDQVRTYVGLVDVVMTYLLLFSAVLLSAFSIPNDIKQQTIHTILTKPVQRFEIVLGRFLGYSALMSLILLAMTGVSLLYLVWEVNPDAAAESLKARDPVWGELRFEGTGSDPNKGINVGREWAYRSYISGPMPGQPTHTAIWHFTQADLPTSSFANRKSVRSEFAFDIFRSTKGVENKGITVAFYFRTSHYHRGNEDLYRKDLEERRKARVPDADALNELSEKYGYYEIPAVAVSSFHTYGQDLPAGLFKSIEAGPDKERKDMADATKQPLYPLEVRVQCRSATQYVGMAKYDFWLRRDDPAAGRDKLWFAYNFFKSQAVNLWLKLLLVIGVSVSLSTYLSGVISLLVGLVLYFVGIILNFMQSVAFGKNYGGGPFQSMYDLMNRKLATQTGEQSNLIKVAYYSDEVVRFGMRRVLDLFPDVSRYDFTRFVEEGFNIPESQIFVNFLLMAAYVLPWIVLAYYLMKWKEVASAT